MTLIVVNWIRHCLMGFLPLSVKAILDILRTSDIPPGTNPALDNYIQSFKDSKLSAEQDQVVLLLLGTKEASESELEEVEIAIDHAAFLQCSRGPSSPPVNHIDMDGHGLQWLYSHFDVLSKIFLFYSLILFLISETRHW
jgi:hypothetical protein